MSEWDNSKNNPSGDFHKLLQEHLDKANLHRKIAAEEKKRLTKIETIEWE